MGSAVTKDKTKGQDVKLETDKNGAADNGSVSSVSNTNADEKIFHNKDTEAIRLNSQIATPENIQSNDPATIIDTDNEDDQTEIVASSADKTKVLPEENELGDEHKVVWDLKFDDTASLKGNRLGSEIHDNDYRNSTSIAESSDEGTSTHFDIHRNSTPISETWDGTHDKFAQRPLSARQKKIISHSHDINRDDERNPNHVLSFTDSHITPRTPSASINNQRRRYNSLTEHGYTSSNSSFSRGTSPNLPEIKRRPDTKFKCKSEVFGSPLPRTAYEDEIRSHEVSLSKLPKLPAIESNSTDIMHQQASDTGLKSPEKQEKPKPMRSKSADHTSNEMNMNRNVENDLLIESFVEFPVEEESDRCHTPATKKTENMDTFPSNSSEELKMSFGNKVNQVEDKPKIVCAKEDTTMLESSKMKQFVSRNVTPTQEDDICDDETQNHVLVDTDENYANEGYRMEKLLASQGDENKGRVICVQLNRDDLDTEEIEEFFENTYLTGGGLIESIEPTSYGYRITFEEPKAYTIMQSNMQLTYKDVDMKVMLTPTQPEHIEKEYTYGESFEAEVVKENNSLPISKANDNSTTLDVARAIPSQPLQNSNGKHKGNIQPTGKAGKTSVKKGTATKTAPRIQPTPKRKPEPTAVPTKNNMCIEFSGFQNLNRMVDVKPFSNLVSRGNKNVLQMECNESANLLYLTFSDQDGQTIIDDYMKGHVTTFKGKRMKLRAIDLELMNENPYYQYKPTATMVLSEIDDTITEDDIRQQFSVEISSVDIVSNKAQACVTFAKPEDAESVYRQRDSFQLKGKPLQINLLQSTFRPSCAKFDLDNVLFVTNLPNPITEQNIKHYFEKIHGCGVKNVKFGQIPGTAFVFMKGKPDYREAYKIVCRKPLKGNMITVDLVPKPLAIEVYGSDNLNSAHVKEYLQKKYLTVVIDRCDPKVDNCIMVWCKSNADAVTLTETGKKHNIKGKEVTVKLHYQCIGLLPPKYNSSLPPVILPEEFHFRPTDPKLLVLVCENSKYFTSLGNELESVNCTLTLESDHNSLVLTPTITKDMHDARERSLHWKKHVTDLVEEYISRFKYDAIAVPENASVELQSKLGLKNSDSCSAVLKVSLFGTVDEVETAKTLLNEEMDELAKQGDRKNRLVTNVIEVHDSRQMELLEKLGTKGLLVDLEEEYSDMKIKVVRKQRIEIQGVDTEVDQVNTIITMTIEDMEEDTIEFSSRIQSLYKHADIEEILNELFANEICVYRTDSRKTKLELYARKKDIQRLKYIVLDKISEGTVVIKEKSNRVMRHPGIQFYDEFTRKLEDKDNMKIYIKHVENTIEFAAIGEYEVIWTVKQEIIQFLEKYRVQTVTIMTPPGITDYVKGWMQSDLEGVTKPADITFRFPDDGSGIALCGLDVTLKDKQDELSNVLLRVKVERHHFNKPGMSNYFSKDVGILKLKEIEETSKVSIKKEDEESVLFGEIIDCEYKWDYEEDDFSESESDEILYHEDERPAKTYKGVCLQQISISTSMTLQLIHGDITLQSTTAIVNAANEDLKHIGGVAKAIVNKGGKSIQAESDAYIKKHGKVAVSGTFVSSSGKLPCKKVIHVVGPRFSKGAVNMNERKELEKAVDNVLKAASEHKCTSLSMPAVSGGIFGCPPNVCAKIIMKTIRNFAATYKSSLQNIAIVDMGEDIIQNFMDIFPKYESTDNITEYRTMEINETVNMEYTEDFRRSPGFSRRRDDPNITLYIADITQHNVDVIVNTTGTSLNLNSGGVSKAILKAAGPSIQDECKLQAPNGLSFGEIITTTSGDMKTCRSILHGACQSYSDDESLRHLESFIRNCLETANNLGYTSIGLPAIGTGQLSYPADKVFNCMVETIHTFYEQSKSLNLFHLLVHPSDTKTKKVFEQQYKDYEGSIPQGVHDDNVFEDYETVPQRREITDSDSDDGEVADNLPITLHLADLTLHKADVIVNTTNTSLDLNTGGVSTAILKVAGKSIQDEIMQKAPDGIQYGDLVTSSSGNMNNCIAVYHGAFQSYNDSNTEPINQLRSFIEECLLTADKDQRSSIALPAIGTGQLGYPAEVVFDLMVQTINTFCTQVRYLNSFHFVVHPRDEKSKTVYKKKYDELKAMGGNKGRSKTKPHLPNIQHGGNIEVKMEDITKCVVDVVVNTTTTSLNLDSGGVSRAIFKAAGRNIQDECRRNAGGSVQYGEMAVSSGGNMPCKEIYHVACLSYQQSDPQTTQSVHDAIQACLEAAHQSGHRTIVFPPIGTGNLNYTPQHMVSILMEEIINFCNRNGKSALPSVIVSVPENENEKYQIICDALNPNASSKKASGLMGLNLKIVPGDITKQSVDAIVNTTSKDLNLSGGGVSSAIAKAAGPNLQAECNQKAPSGIMPGDVLVTGAGNLNCKHVFHTSCLQWNSGQSSSKQIYTQTLDNILSEAENNRINSIAIPAIGTGNLHFPEDYVAATMCQIIESFDAHHLQEVIIVIRNEDKNIHAAFTSYMEQNPGTVANPNIKIMPFKSRAKTASRKKNTTRTIIIGHIKLEIVFHANLQQEKTDAVAVESKHKATLQNFKKVIPVETPTEKDWKLWKRCFKHMLSEAKDYSSLSFCLPLNSADEDGYNLHDLTKILAECLCDNTTPKITHMRILVTSPYEQGIVLDILKKLTEARSIAFHIYGTSKDSINEAKAEIDKVCNEQSQERTLSNELFAEFVRNLTPSETQDIKDLQEKKPVKITICPGTKTCAMKIEGLETDYHFILGEINKMKDEKIQKQKTENERINRIALEEERKKTEEAERKTKLIEDEVEKLHIRFPTNWTNSSYKSGKKHHEEMLSQYSPEYINVSQMFAASLNYPSMQVNKILRIENPHLHKAFEVRKHDMSEQNGNTPEMNERLLWHGTDENAVQEINVYGFNRSFCGKNATVYGNGVYFAVNANYSHGYANPSPNGMHRMYLCRVLTGEFTQGESGMIVPPLKVDNIKYDTVVNNVQNPAMHVCFYDDQAYPKYLIEYKV